MSTDVDAPTDAPLATRTLLRDRTLLSLFAITLTAMSAISAISPAFPEASRALGVPESRIGLLITLYTLPGIVLTPIWGVFADRHGRKVSLITASTIFGAGGIACALAPSFAWLRGVRPRPLEGAPGVDDTDPPGVRGRLRLVRRRTLMHAGHSRQVPVSRRRVHGSRPDPAPVAATASVRCD